MNTFRCLFFSYIFVCLFLFSMIDFSVPELTNMQCTFCECVTFKCHDSAGNFLFNISLKLLFIETRRELISHHLSCISFHIHRIGYFLLLCSHSVVPSVCFCVTFVTVSFSAYYLGTMQGHGSPEGAAVAAGPPRGPNTLTLTNNFLHCTIISIRNHARPC